MSEQLEDKQLLVADTSTLSNDQLMRRSALINIRKAERELDLAEYQNQKFRDEQETRRMMNQAKIENIKAIQDKEAREKLMCKHMTGGMDKPGFFNGDGDKYGTCTALLQLPTTEIYALCFRCDNEWHAPSKRAVINGEISLAMYYTLLKKYNEVLAWPRKSFAPWMGEICAASLFNIPKLKAQQEKDNRDFVVFMSKLPPQTISLAQVGVEPTPELTTV